MRLRRTLTLLLALTLGFACLAEAAGSPKQGKWKGPVTKGKTINFKVKKGKVVKLGGTAKGICRSSADGSTRKLNMPFAADRFPIPADGEFEWVHTSALGITTAGTGKFKGRKKAAGTVSLTLLLGATNEECIADATWRAKRKR